jgi:hypothetical protein
MVIDYSKRGSYFVFTIYGTYNAISHDKCSALLRSSFKSTCGVSSSSVVLAVLPTRYVAQVFSE